MEVQNILASSILLAGTVALLSYAFAEIDTKNAELSSVLSNVAFLGTLLYRHPGNKEEAAAVNALLLVIQVSACTVAGYSLGYHNYRHRGGSREFPRYADLLASEEVATSALIVSGYRFVTRFSSWTWPVLSAISCVSLLVINFLPGVLDIYASTPTAKESVLLEWWTASAMVLAVLLAPVRFYNREDGVKAAFAVACLFVPLAGSALPQANLVDLPMRQERALHTVWHMTNAIAISFVCGCIGGQPVLLPEAQNKDWGWVACALYLSFGLAVVILASTWDACPWQWLAPTLLSVVVILGIASFFVLPVLGRGTIVYSKL